MTYESDILIQYDSSTGEFDINFANGQPDMTAGFETAVLLAIFVPSTTWHNATAATKDEKYVSTFPDVIANGRVDEQTKNNGIEAIKLALKFLVDSKAASRVDVSASILSVYAIGWAVDIYAPEPGTVTRYRMNWERGSLTAKFYKEAA